MLGLLICFFLIVPSVKEDAVSDNSAAVLSINNALMDSQSEASSLRDQVSSLEAALAQYEGKADISSSYDTLIEAYNYYNTYDYSAAKDDILLVNKDVLGTAGQLLYDDLYAKLTPTILADYYNVGMEFYKEENYERAVSNFRTVVEMDETYESGNALFLLGDCLRLTGNGQEALTYYNRVVELYSYRNIANQAKEYIMALGGGSVSEGTGSETGGVTD